ncbi:MAG TPA: nitronate monooxygenase [Solirubrobacterales bacterium]|nr:nitronate monooxygenase [Solirubrobacterales bacterium]
MPPLLQRLGVELPVVQAGMGGGISGHELAAAVSEAGGLGTIAVNGARAIERELAAARKLTGRPLAVNVLLPFARRDWFAAAAGADVVVTFWGRPRRRVGGCWIHQCGSVAEARAAHRAGADAAILQGVEAGGHVRGTTPALRLLEEARAALPAEFPLLLAGGIAEAADVRGALGEGAEGAVAGTRFLLSQESRAHPAYRDRLLAADGTMLTDLFGAAWPAPHRVIPNAATEHWLGPVGGPRGRAFAPIRNKSSTAPPLVRAPWPNRAVNRLLAPGARYTPVSVQAWMARRQRPQSRLLSPAPPTRGAPDSLVEAGALYAGESVARIATLAPAAQLVRDLAG